MGWLPGGTFVCSFLERDAKTGSRGETPCACSFGQVAKSSHVYAPAAGPGACLLAGSGSLRPRRAVPWVAAAAAPAPDVGVSGRTEGGAAPGGPRCGFISGAGRDARRRQGAAKQQEAARSLAGPTAAQPGPGRRW